MPLPAPKHDPSASPEPADNAAARQDGVDAFDTDAAAPAGASPAADLQARVADAFSAQRLERAPKGVAAELIVAICAASMIGGFLLYATG